MSKLRPLFLIGTRPEAIKMAPIIHQCQTQSDDVAAIVCTTGQHKELLQQVIDYFQVPVERDLALMQPDQTLAGLTARCITAVDQLLAELKPDCVVGQGDTTTVLCAAMAAFYRRLPFVHIEAGLRTGNLYSPWPEEMNRRVASIVTAVHCAPTQGAVNNLLREGADPKTVHLTGNTVIDALMSSIERERARENDWQKQFPMVGKSRMVLITGHRRENFGAGFEQICLAIAALSKQFPDVQFVYPVHLNPNVQKPVRALLSTLNNVHLLPPASYPAFVWLMDRSTVILTDSGGVQEEAPSLKKPVLVMRDTTERPEAVDAGAAELVGTDSARIIQRVGLLLTDQNEYRRRQIATNPYGDGKASQRIVQLMLQMKRNP
ncbi:MAG TPA: UDP-N-acetylglucosamine 2-epimerase (non-hydrolyzing) [Tepidisphaeraceae bacterium]|nr:UDP-N-acetylglucosamine 2-epimerase (non-hydrolyzing) [Tepidisphaeraceae bacterium]